MVHINTQDIIYSWKFRLRSLAPAPTLVEKNPLLKNLVKALAEELSTNQNEEDDWITTEEAMSILKISSKTTLKKYRDQNDIKYSAPIGSKHILYSKSSLLKFIEDKANMPWMNKN